jgi:ATP-dependent helicase/nuclease subunit A
MNLPLDDEKARQEALDPTQSFIVQAPAGSGKTELLTQRYLALLVRVNTPEEIIAITFTNKAVAEMRERILRALRLSFEPEPASSHQKRTWSLAKKVIEHDTKNAWNIIENPNRLRIQTIDALCMRLSHQMPINAALGTHLSIADDIDKLYRKAIQRLFDPLHQNELTLPPLEKLVVHLNNNMDQLENLLVSLLGNRDQWLPHIIPLSHTEDLEPVRQSLENTLSGINQLLLEKIDAAIPAPIKQRLVNIACFSAEQLRKMDLDSPIVACCDLTTWPSPVEENLPVYQGISTLIFTKTFDYRKQITKRTGFPPPSGGTSPDQTNEFKRAKEEITDILFAMTELEECRHAFKQLSFAPPCHYAELDWEVLSALLSLLPLCVAHLRVIFQETNTIDYTESLLAAILSLGEDDNPTDMALTLDYQINHILIDEFQDTSLPQYRLLEKLTAGWQPGDTRTLFIVGDPMQSIYRFRQAEVSLFLQAKANGVGNIPCTSLTLNRNFRSHHNIIDWVNEVFQPIFPAKDNLFEGGITYSPSQAVLPYETESHCTLHALEDTSENAESTLMLTLIQDSLQKNLSTAVLVRSRQHLARLLPMLKTSGVPFVANEIESLFVKPPIQDLMALTKAIFHLADKTAWLSVLRAPWCGFTLADLLLLENNFNHTVYASLPLLLVDPDLSPHGQKRLTEILPYLTHCVDHRHRGNLRLAIETLWLAIGGPATLSQPHELDSTDAFFTLLEQLPLEMQQSKTLDKHLGHLYAPPELPEQNSVQIMTIHKAKGLEFGTVIIPSCEKSIRPPARQLLSWLEFPLENHAELILAPLSEDKENSIERFLREQEKIKSEYELARLFYVATTRAKTKLHLVGCIAQDESKALVSPRLNSFFGLLFSHQQENFHIEKIGKMAPEQSASLPPYTSTRLPSNWQLPSEAHFILRHFSKSPPPQANNDLLREDILSTSLGTCIHFFLEIIAKKGIEHWNGFSSSHQTQLIQNKLNHLFVPAACIPDTLSKTLTAISTTLADPVGQWILSNHPESATELSLSVREHKQFNCLVIDRTFIDEKGVRWIIDYKTTDFQGSDLESFLKQALDDHREQLTGYARAFEALSPAIPIKIALYYPLNSGWISERYAEL